DDVPDLVDELWIRRELERRRLVRLQPERPPDPAHGALAHPGRRRQRARRPIRLRPRLLLERLHDHPLDVRVRERPRLARPRLVVQTITPAPSEAHTPLAHRAGVTAKRGGDLIARSPLSGREHDLATKRQRLRTRRPPSPPLKHYPLLIVQHDLRPL